MQIFIAGNEQNAVPSRYSKQGDKTDNRWDTQNARGDPNTKNATILNIQLEYYNSSSSACLLSVFKKLEKFNKGKGSPVTINWIYEENDEDIFTITLQKQKLDEVRSRLPFWKDGDSFIINPS